MISVEKPGSPMEILEHYGVKGQKWGVRKKTAIVVGSTALAGPIGTAFAVYLIRKNGKTTVSSLPQSVKSAEETRNRILKEQGQLKASEIPDPKLLAEHQKALKKMSEQADWSTDWNAIAKANNPEAFK